MVRLNVPFYSNTPDNLHCFQAALKSVLKYFLPEKEFSWKKLDKITGLKKGLWTWPQRSLIYIKKIGFDVVNLEDFDYGEFSKRGGKYLVKKYGREVAAEQIKNSNIEKERKVAKEFLKIFGNPKTAPEVGDIRDLLNNGYLVICLIAANALDGGETYIGHFVVITDYDDKNFYLHDPGLPPRKNRKVSFENFIKAWAYPDEKAANLMAFKYPG